MSDFNNAVYRELAEQVLDGIQEPVKLATLVDKLRKQRVGYIYDILDPLPTAMETLGRICDGKVGPTPLAVKLQDLKLIEPVGNGNGNWIATVLGYDVWRYNKELIADIGVPSKADRP